MSLEIGLDPFIKFFYYCGLSGYPFFEDFLTNKSDKRKFWNFVPTVVLIIFTIIMSSCACASKFVSDPENKSGAHTLYVNTFTLLATVVVCSTQTFLRSSYFIDICSQMSSIERLSWRNFPVVAFRRHFMRRVYISIFVFVLPVAVKFIAKPLTWHTFIATTSLAALRAFVFLSLLHAFFYVDLLDHMLQSFVEHIDMRATTALSVAVHTIKFRNPATRQMTAEILHFKIWHFILWEISKKINRVFGWTIVIVFLEHLIYASYNVYAGYVSFTQQTVSMVIFMRKSMCVLCW